MKNLKIMYVILLVAGSHVTNAQKSVEQKVLSLSAAKFNWMINNKLDSLASILDDEVRYHHSNGYIQKKVEVIDDFKNGKLILRKVDVAESSVRVYPNCAIVMGSGLFEGVMNGNEFSSKLQFTEVYIKSKNQWKLASRHANKMP